MREYTVSHATIYVRAGDRALIDRVRALTRQQGTSLSALTIRLLREWEERQEAEREGNELSLRGDALVGVPGDAAGGG